MINKNISLIMVIGSAVLWAMSGISGQMLFGATNMSTSLLTTIRLLSAGTVLLAIGGITEGKKVFAIWHNKRDAILLLLFAFIGCMLVQYSYFESIKLSNAATGTILQYSSPVIVVLMNSIIHKRLPSVIESICCVLAVCGVFLVSTGGNVKSLNISALALIWGLISAFTLAFYTVEPESLLKKYSAFSVVGFGMLMGGIALALLTRPFGTAVEGIGFKQICEIVFIIVFGTIVPFSAFSKGVSIIGSTKGSILATIEPMTAFLVSLFFLGEKYPPLSILGFIFIISAVILISTSGKRAKNVK